MTGPVSTQPTAVLCGSLARHSHVFPAVAASLWQRGFAVYAPVLDPDQSYEEHAARHRALIDMAALVVVVTDQDGAVGEATASERDYAAERGVPVEVWPVSTPDPAADPRPNPLAAAVKWFERVGTSPVTARPFAEQLHRAVYGPELARLRDEATEAHTRNANLRADQGTRHRALLDALGVTHLPGHNEPTRYYAAIEQVHQLRAERDRLHETNGWLSEACRLTVREAASVRDERDRLLKDATPARQKLMDLIGGDWTVEPSLFDLAYYAERFWGQDREDLASLRETAGLVSGSTPTIPDDAEEQIARRIADYWQGVRETVGPDDSDYGIAHQVLALVRGWGSAVANPTDGAAGQPQANSKLDQNLDDLLGIDRTDPVQDLACRLVEADTQLLRALVAVRRRSGLTQADIALRMGRPLKVVIDLEREDADPKLSTLRRYALAIGALVTHQVAAGAVDPRTPDQVAEDTTDVEHHATWTGKTPSPDGGA